MKKITLCIVVLLIVLCGVARADIPNPPWERHLKSLGDLPLAERLKRCNQMPDLPLDNINHIGHFWEVREWYAMDCSEILSPQELSVACEKLTSRCRHGNPHQRAPSECCPSEENLYRAEEQFQQDYLNYVLIGAGVFLLCGLAAWLLLRARKK